MARKRKSRKRSLAAKKAWRKRRSQRARGRSSKRKRSYRSSKRKRSYSKRRGKRVRGYRVSQTSEEAQAEHDRHWAIIRGMNSRKKNPCGHRSRAANPFLVKGWKYPTSQRKDRLFKKEKAAIKWSHWLTRGAGYPSAPIYKVSSSYPGVMSGRPRKRARNARNPYEIFYGSGGHVGPFKSRRSARKSARERLLGAHQERYLHVIDRDSGRAESVFTKGRTGGVSFRAYKPWEKRQFIKMN